MDFVEKGLFISLEGIEATGKSTISKMLQDRFQNVVLTREPGGIKASEEIRDVIMENEISPESELLLFLASRREHLEKKILPNVDKGNIVICDRYAHSSFAYQGYGRGLEVDEVYKLNNFATGGVFPDITFVIDVPVAISMDRKSLVEDQNRMDNEKKEFYERVRNGYIEMSKDDKYGNICLLDGKRSIEEIAQSIEEHINYLISVR